MNRLFKPSYHLFFILVLFTISFCIGISEFSTVYAASGINQVINFQGKVVNSDGTNVTDGTYDFVFNLYDGAGSAASSLFSESWTSAALFSSTMSSAPGLAGESLTYSSNTNEATLKVGQILWNTTKGESVTITSVNTGTNVLGISPTIQAWAGSDTITNKIYVKDGVFHVNINSLTQSFSGVDFNSDSIFVGMNFNANGEMKPRIQFTSVPYALNAQKVGGLTVTNTTGTFTLANSKTLTVNNTLAFSGTDGMTFTFPSGSGTVVTNDSTSVLTNKSIGSTGLTFSGASTDITTGTNEHLAIMPNGTGNVGIGTTAPGYKLTIAGDIGTTGDYYTSQSGSAFAQTLNSSNGYFRFMTTVGGVLTEKVRIANDGNVGIGTTAPSSKLQVTDGSDSLKFLSGNGGIAYEWGGGERWRVSSPGSGTIHTGLFIYGNEAGVGTPSNGSNVLNFMTGGTERMRINSSGNVGIGTTAPSQALHVSGSARITGALYDSSNSAGSSGMVLSSTGTGTTWASISTLGIVGGTGTDNYLSRWNAAGTGLENGTLVDNATSGLSLNIDSSNNVGIGGTSANVRPSLYVGASGNLGIGTTSPGQKLQIIGNVDIGDGTTNSIGYRINGNRMLYLDTSGAYLNLDQSSQPLRIHAGGGQRIYVGTNGNVGIGSNYSTPSQLFDVNGQLVVNGSSGNVGIGTTNPGQTLDVVGKLRIQNSGDAGGVVFREFGSGSALEIMNVGDSSYLPVLAGSFSAEDGSLNVPGFNFGATSGDYNTGIRRISSDKLSIVTGASDRLTIDATGNVGIGTTSPLALLDVAGTSWLRGSTAASGGLYVDSSGNVGIGNTSPTTKLTIGPASGGSTNQLLMNASNQTISLKLNDTNSGLYTMLQNDNSATSTLTVSSNANAADPGFKVNIAGSLGGVRDLFAVQKGGSSLFYINNSGNVGIGTTAPSNSLHLYSSNGGLNIQTSGSVNPRVGFYNSAGTIKAVTGYNVAGDYAYSGYGGNANLTINSGGNVGIGTTAPSSMFSVGAASEFQVNSTGNIVKLNNVTTSFPSSQGAANSFLRNDGAGTLTWADPTSTGVSGFWQRNGTSLAPTNIGDNVGIGTSTPTEQLDIVGALKASTYGIIDGVYIGYNKSTALGNLSDGEMIQFGATSAYDLILKGYSAGNVGIGTTAPSTKLHVVGDARITGALYDSSNSAGSSGMVLSSTGTGTTWASISTLGIVGGTGTDNYLSRWNSAGTGLENATLVDNATSGLSLNIDSSNNVGIGGTSANVRPSLYVGANGNIGIGTTAPTNKLQIESSGGAFIGIQRSDSVTANGGLRMMGSDGVVDAEIAYNNSIGGAMTFYSNSAHRMIIDSTGNVGIGTTSPGAKLDVLKDATWNDGTLAGLTVSNATTPSKQLRFGYDSTADISFIQSAQTSVGTKNLMLQGQGGNVGIGTTAPNNLLTLEASGSMDKGIHIVSGATAIGSLETISVGGTLSLGLDGGSGRPLALNSQVSSNVLLATGGGNVGIGTTNPNYKLTVEGAARIHTAANGEFLNINDSQENWHLGTYSGSNLYINNDTASTLLTLTRTGNVGIGTTAPGALLSLGTGSTEKIRLYDSGTASTSYGLGISTGDMQLFAASGWNMSFRDGGYNGTVNMFINGSGNVGIGTTAPSSKLHVSGSGEIITVGATNAHNLQLMAQDGGVKYDYNTDVRFQLSGNAQNIFGLGGPYGGLKLGGSSQFSYIVGAGTNLLLNPTAGNVGIGTTSPSQKLQIGDASNDGTVYIAGKLSGGVTSTQDSLMVMSYGSGTNATGGIVWGGDVNQTIANLSYGGRLSSNNGGKIFIDSITDTSASSMNFRMRTYGTDVNAMTILGDGDVGIGTTAPGAKLEVNGIAKVSSGYYLSTPEIRLGGYSYSRVGYNNGDGSPYIGYNTVYDASDSRLEYDSLGTLSAINTQSGGLKFYTGTSQVAGTAAVERMTLDTSGNLGVGTASPNARLTVKGAGATSQDFFHIEDSAGTRMLEFISNANGDGLLAIKDTSGATDISLNTNGDSYFTGGNVGIGNIAPDSQLQVIRTSSGATTNAFAIGNGDIANNTGARLNFNLSSTATFYPAYIEAVRSNSGGAGATFMDFATHNGTTVFERMRLSESGNLGIGTTAPGVLFDVAGNGRLTGVLQVGNSTPVVYSRIGTAATSYGSFIAGSNDLSVSGDIEAQGRFLSPIGQFGIFYDVDNSNYFVDPSAAISAAFAGNVGIGTTAPGMKLDIVGGNMRLGNSSTGDINFGNATGDNYQRIRYNNSSGDLIFQTNLAGTVVDSLAIDYNTGNVGIGTTSPGYKLEVNGTLFTTGTAQFSNGSVVTGTGKLYTNSDDFYLSADDNANGTGKIHLSNSGTEVMTLNSGNVGIGATSPLAVTGKSLTLSDSSQVRLFFEDTGYESSGQGLGFLTWDSGIFSVQNASRSGSGTTGTATLMTILENGNVGIGTTAPGQKLEIAGGHIQIDNATALKTKNSGGTTRNLIYMDGNNVTHVAGDAGDVINILSSGNVGIGTTAPAQKLDVTGNIQASNVVLANGGTYTGFTAGGVQLGANSILAGGAVGYAGNSTTALWAGSGMPLVFGTNGTENMRLTSGGNLGIGTTAPSALLDLAHGGTTTTGLNLSANSLTTGYGFNLSSTSTALSTGTLMNLDWSPTTATNATGDLFVIGIGSSGNVGTIFNIKDSGNSLFSVSESQVTSAIPHAFTAAGDLSVAYDMQFTNQTASYIKSNAPLYIEAGEAFENNNLTLKTYGSGNVVMDFNGTGSYLQLSGTDSSMLFDTKTVGDTDFWMGIQDDGGSDDDDKLMIGKGLTGGSSPFMTFNASGNIGIGTTSPNYKVSFVGTQATHTMSVVNLASTNASTTAVVRLSIGTATGAANTNARFVQFYAGATADNNGTAIGKIRQNNAAIAYDTSGADFAEYFHIEESTEYGDIIATTPQGNKKATDSQTLLGVVSDSSGFIGNAKGENPEGTIVGLLGQIQTKVSTINGIIRKGDQITSSSITGFGKKMSNAGFTVGKALEDFDPAHGKGTQIACPVGTPAGIICGKVNTLVSPSWFDTRVFITETGDINGASTPLNPGVAAKSNTEGLVVTNKDALAKDIISLLQTNAAAVKNTTTALTIYADKLIAGLEIVTPHVSADLVSVKDIESLDSTGVALHLTQDGEFTVKNASGEAVIRFDDEGNAFFNGLITAKGIKADQIEGIQFLTKKISDLENVLSASTASAQIESQVATTAAELTVTPTPTLSAFDILTASTSALLSYNPNWLESKTSSEVASLSGLSVSRDATVSGQLHIAGSSLIEGVLNVIHTVTTNNFISTGWSDFMGSVIFRGNVAFTQPPTFTQDTAGIAVVKKGSDSIRVKFTKEYDNAPIINTTISFSTPAHDKKDANENFERMILEGDIRYLIINKSAKGFTIKLNKKATDDIEFSWMAVAVRQPEAVPSVADPIQSVSTSSSQLTTMEEH